MGLLDAFHSINDLRGKSADRRSRRHESQAKVSHVDVQSACIDAETQARLAAIQMERDRLNHEIAKDYEAIILERKRLNMEIAIINHYARKDADIEYHGVRARIPRASVTVTPEEQAAIPAASLPGRIDFIEILESWRPSQQQIFLGLAPGGQFVTVPLLDLCHVALAGSTGAGKSNLMRLLLSQLLYIGCHVVIADPHYTPIDVESGEDWRPIEKRLAVNPAVSAKEIRDLLKWAADALPKRLELRRRGERVGKPLFIAMDELPSIVAKLPEAPSYMGEIGREGRKVGVFLISSAQDFLVRTIGGTGAARDNFRTALYSGGDATTARVLLDVKGNPDNGSLGKGIVLARSQAQPVATLMRVPYCSNQALYKLLPTAGGTSQPTSEPLHFEPTGPVIEAARETRGSALDVRSLRVREMLKSRMSQRQIIKELYGIDGGAKYQEAAKELSDIIAKLV